MRLMMAALALTGGILAANVAIGISHAGAPGTVTVIMSEYGTGDAAPFGCVKLTGPLHDAVCDQGPGDDSLQEGVIVYDGVPGVYTVQETVPPPGYALNASTYQCNATSDLLCVVNIGHFAAGVGGATELSDVSAAATSGSAAQNWLLLAGLVGILIATGGLVSRFLFRVAY